MPGRRPIFATLVSGSYYVLRDFLYKRTIEPKAPDVRKSQDVRGSSSPQKEKKPW